MLRFFAFIMFVVVMVVSPVLPMSHSHAGIIEFLFPSLRVPPPNPEETGVAPFANDKTVVEEKGRLKDLPYDATPLSTPHLSRDELKEWVMVSASEVMNFQAGNFREDFRQFSDFFDKAGVAQYFKFLQDNNVKKVVDSRRYNVSAYAEDIPLLLNEGVVHDRYRWLYRVPIIVSFVDKDLRDYDENQIINQRMILTIQVGRIRDESKDSGLQIEQWSGKVEKMAADSQ